MTLELKGRNIPKISFLCYLSKVYTKIKSILILKCFWMIEFNKLIQK